jgi:hypothetical protein
MSKLNNKPLLSGRQARLKKRAKQLTRRLKAVPASQLLELLPESLLQQVSDSTQVDYQVKHLEGRLMVLLLLQGILTDKDDSLRSLEHLYNSPSFAYFSGKGTHHTRHSSLADRLSHIQVSFFEELYAGFLSNVRAQYGRRLEKEYGWLWRFDSTMVALSGALSEIGMRVGARPKLGEGVKQIKFSVGLQGLIPSTALLLHDQKDLSEDRALYQLIEQAAVEPQQIAVFDRGLKSRKAFKHFSERGLYFVTRLSTPRYEVVAEHKNIKGRHHGELTFHADQIVHLYESGDQEPMRAVSFRLITAICTQGENAGKTFYLLTNILDLTAFQIAEVYRKRWDIELFFRFLKQQIGLRHLLAYNENGIRAVFYVRLLCATMLQLFYWLNQRTDAKIAKRDFADQLQWEQFIIMALLAGADPLKLKKQLDDYQGIKPKTPT